MKNKIILILILILSIINVKADLTQEQGEKIAKFAEQMIEKGNSEEHRVGKFSLLVYRQGQYRIDGFNDKLSNVDYDYYRYNTLGNKKYWTFDCSSFASYVYYHVLGFHTYKNNNPKSPLVVSEFVTRASKNDEFYFVFRNKPVTSVDFSTTKPGDLFIFEGSHIMVYIGNKKIAHFTASEIHGGGPILGAVISDITVKYPDKKLTVIRANGTNATPVTTITWPDTGKIEELVEDYKPTIRVTNENKGKKEVKITIEIKDDNQLTSYSITNGDPNYQTIQGKSATINHTFKENGTYYIYAKDNKNQETKFPYIVNGIEKEEEKPPVIEEPEEPPQEEPVIETPTIIDTPPVIEEPEIIEKSNTIDEIIKIVLIIISLLIIILIIKYLRKKD